MENICHDCVICRESLRQDRATESDQRSSAFNREVRVREVVELTCNHKFHSDCIEKWVVKNPQCPLDRLPITTLPPESINNLHRMLLKFVENNEIDDVRGILSTGLLDLGQLCALDHENLLTVLLNNEQWEMSAELLRAGLTTTNRKTQNLLGQLYENGLGVEQDFAKAFDWYRKAAEQGDPEAQNTVGYMYETGLGVGKDCAEAMKWYRAAADQGDASAQNNVGLMYQNGTVVRQDFVQAVAWYRLSAAQGNSIARNNLYNMFHDGLVT